MLRLVLSLVPLVGTILAFGLAFRLFLEGKQDRQKFGSTPEQYRLWQLNNLGFAGFLVLGMETLLSILWGELTRQQPSEVWQIILPVIGLGVAAVSAFMVFTITNILGQDACKKDGVPLNPRLLQVEIVGNAFAVPVLGMSAWLADYRVLSTGLLLLGLLVPVFTVLLFVMGGIWDICLTLRKLWQRKQPFRKRFRQPPD